MVWGEAKHARHCEACSKTHQRQPKTKSAQTKPQALVARLHARTNTHTIYTSRERETERRRERQRGREGEREAAILIPTRSPTLSHSLSLHTSPRYRLAYPCRHADSGRITHIPNTKNTLAFAHACTQANALTHTHRDKHQATPAPRQLQPTRLLLGNQGRRQVRTVLSRRAGGIGWRRRGIG